MACAQLIASCFYTQVLENPEELEARLEVLAGRKSNRLPEIRVSSEGLLTIGTVMFVCLLEGLIR
jgi:hypothetical protein